MHQRTIAASLLFCASLAQAGDADQPDPMRWFNGDHAMAKLLILGTFHFKDAGLDGYKPEIDVDIMAPARQHELDALLDRLEAYAPTKVLLECDFNRQTDFDKRYADYRAGSFELSPNEIYQVGFKLAGRLYHPRIFCVDADGRNYADLPDDFEAYAKDKGQADLLDSPWGERYSELYQRDDRAKADRSLIETLLFSNSPDRLRVGHGHYVLRSLALGDADEYPSTDAVTGWWYNRNLRIVANIMRVMEEGDRLFLLIGSGHVPIILHAVDASPVFDTIDVASVLQD